MSLLDEFNDPRLAILKPLLGEDQPNAVWHATGARKAYGRFLDPRTHHIRVTQGEDSDELREKLREVVYSDPGLYRLMAYTRDQVVRKSGDVRVIINVCDGIYCALVDEGRQTSVVAMLGVPAAALDRLAPLKEARDGSYSSE